jgi:hypothetical protein
MTVRVRISPFHGRHNRVVRQAVASASAARGRRDRERAACAAKTVVGVIIIAMYMPMFKVPQLVE